MKAMIFAAGLGTRLKPLTDTTPKALVQLAGKSMLEHTILYLSSYGIVDIIINVHHFADEIIDFVKSNNNFGVNISFSDETDSLLDTGGGLKKASWFFEDSESFIVMNVDILTDINLKKLTDHHNLTKSLVTLAVSQRSTSRYLLFNSSNVLSGWVNDKTGETKCLSAPLSELNRYAFSGVQIINPLIFNLLKNEPNKFSIIDAYLKLSTRYNIDCYNHTGALWMDVGKIDEISVANEFAKQLS